MIRFFLSLLFADQNGDPETYMACCTLLPNSY